MLIKTFSRKSTFFNHKIDPIKPNVQIVLISTSNFKNFKIDSQKSKDK